MSASAMMISPKPGKTTETELPQGENKKPVNLRTPSAEDTHISVNFDSDYDDDDDDYNDYNDYDKWRYLQKEKQEFEKAFDREIPTRK
jgi:hypothetical protein